MRRGRVGTKLAAMDDRGATAVEYGLIVALIAVVVIVALTLLGANMSGSFSKTATTVGNVL